MADSVDPRRVLQLINNMGYKNVSSTELKEFTKDLKKLMKYEQKAKSTSVNNQTQVIHAPENVINVTIIQESPKKCDPQPTERIPKPVRKADVQAQTDATQSDSDKVEPTKPSKRLLRLPKHIKTKNPKIIYKKGIVCGIKSGSLVRNTPTDLYQKYQEDWIKFKSYIPGENSRINVRRSIRQKMQQKDDFEAKVYIHFPDEKGDH